jgi:hypothetical protein
MIPDYNEKIRCWDSDLTMAYLNELWSTSKSCAEILKPCSDGMLTIKELLRKKEKMLAKKARSVNYNAKLEPRESP